MYVGAGGAIGTPNSPPSRSPSRKKAADPPPRAITASGQRVSVFVGKSGTTPSPNKGEAAPPVNDGSSSQPAETLGAAGSDWVSGSFRRMESKKASRRERAQDGEEDMSRLPERETTFKPRRQGANGPTQV